MPLSGVEPVGQGPLWWVQREQSLSWGASLQDTSHSAPLASCSRPFQTSTCPLSSHRSPTCRGQAQFLFQSLKFHYSPSLTVGLSPSPPPAHPSVDASSKWCKSEKQPSLLAVKPWAHTLRDGYPDSPQRRNTTALGEGASSGSSKGIPPSKGQGHLLAPLDKGRVGERPKLGLH